MLLCAAAGCMAAVCCSCGDKTMVSTKTMPTEITLSWWGNDSRTEYTLEAVERFEELHPDIRVKCSYSEWSGYEARNRVQMISNTETDVMQINVGWLSEFSSDGKGYYDLEQLADHVRLDNFPEEILEYGRKNGVLNAIPIAMNAETVYINKDIYDSYGLPVPETWDDIFAAAKVMKKDGVYPISAGSKAMCLYCVAYGEQMCGKHFFNENDEITFDADELELMIDFYVRLINEKAAPQVENYSRIDLEKGVYGGSVAWVSDAVNYFGKLIEAGANIVPAPYTAEDPAESGEGWYAKPATLYAISKNTEHPKEAAILLDFMLNSSEWAELQGVEKGVPISGSVREFLSEEGQLSGLQYEAALVMENCDRLTHMNPLIENSDLYDDFISCCNLVLYDKSGSEEAAKELYELYSANYSME